MHIVADDVGIGAEDLRRLKTAGEVCMRSAAPSADAETLSRLHYADVSGVDVAVLGCRRVPSLQPAVDHELELVPEASVAVPPHGGNRLPVAR